MDKIKVSHKVKGHLNSLTLALAKAGMAHVREAVAGGIPLEIAVPLVMRAYLAAGCSVYATICSRVGKAPDPSHCQAMLAEIVSVLPVTESVAKAVIERDGQDAPAH